MDTQLITRSPRTRREAEAAATGLAVHVTWGDRLLATQVLSASGARRFSVGGGRGHDVATGRAGAAVFSVSEAGPVFGFSNGLTGEVWRNGQTPLGLSDVVHRGLAEEGDALWEMAVGRHDSIRVELGGLTVEAVPVRAPRPVTGRPAPDYRWLNVLLTTALLASLVVVRAVVTRLEEAGDEGPLSSAEVARYRRVLVKAPEPVKAVAVTTPAPDKTPPEQRDAAAGSPRPTPAPPREGGGNPNAQRTRDERALAVTTQLRSLFGGPGQGNVFGAGGLGNTLNQAIGTVVGMSDGLGGWQLRGDGTGGLVTGPARLGSIGLVGKKGGYADPTLRHGPSTTPTIDTSPPVTCTADGRGAGCLDRETIRRIIRQHLSQIRFCYEEQLRSAPTMSGKVSVKFHVAPSGAVDEAAVLESAVGATGARELGSCMVGRVRTWVFPGMPYGYTVSYPFIFRPSGT